MKIFAIAIDTIYCMWIGGRNPGQDIHGMIYQIYKHLRMQIQELEKMMFKQKLTEELSHWGIRIEVAAFIAAFPLIYGYPGFKIINIVHVYSWKIFWNFSHWPFQMHNIIDAAGAVHTCMWVLLCEYDFESVIWIRKEFGCDALASNGQCEDDFHVNVRK